MVAGLSLILVNDNLLGPGLLGDRSLHTGSLHHRLTDNQLIAADGQNLVKDIFLARLHIPVSYTHLEKLRTTVPIIMTAS